MWRNLILQVQRIKEEGSFIRHVSIASSWNAGIIASQFLLSPIITRIFAPAEYSVFAIFSSIVANVTLFSTLKYSDAIVLTQSKQQRNNLASVIFVLVSGISILVFVAVLLWRNPLGNFINGSVSIYFLLLIPVGVWLTSILEILVSVNIRKKAYFRNGLSGFALNVTARGGNILYGLFLSAKGIGLVIGDLFGKVVGVAFILHPYKTLQARFKNFRKTISWVEMKSVALHFKSFPMFYLPSTFLVYLSSHLPIFFFQWQFGAAVLGSYALASSLLEIFNRLVPYSLAPLVLQKINDLKGGPQEILADRVYRLFSILSFLSFCIFTGVALLGRQVFPFVFGASWAKAGAFAAVLSIPYAFGFIAVALTEVYNVMGRQRLLLGNSILNVTLRVVAMVFIIQFNLPDILAIFIFGLVSSIGSIVQIIGVFQILNFKLWKVFILLLISLSLLTTITFFQFFF